jgi:hypothetical protein
MKILIALFLISGSFAQVANAQVDQGGQFWSLNMLRGPIGESKRWEYYIEFQPRFDFQNAKLNRFLVRPAAIFNLDSNQSLWAGVLDVFDSELNTNEFRFWQQYQRIDRLDRVIFLNRTRIEERLMNGETDIGLRIRHMLRSQIPLGEESSWSVVVFDEVFLGMNQNRSQPQRGFDQNRAFIGVRKDFNNKLFYEVGYLNQFNGKKMNHVPFVTIGKLIR